MQSLEHVARRNPQWSLEEFVEAVNQYLPQFLPLSGTDARVQEAVNARLVRHYASQGLIDKPLRAGREARYGYRHLLQLLLVRRLLMEGYSSTAIDRLAVEKTNDELEALLQGGIQLTLETANPALAFLQAVERRQESGHRQRAVRKAPPSPQEQIAGAAASRWTRIELMPGLEVQVRDDFVPPKSQFEWQSLFELLRRRLESVISWRSKS